MIRGPCEQLRWYNGMNFIEMVNWKVARDEKEWRKSLSAIGCELVFNFTHSSFFDGTRKRKVDLIWRSLDHSLQQIGPIHPERDELQTLLIEAIFIVNSNLQRGRVGGLQWPSTTPSFYQNNVSTPSDFSVQELFPTRTRMRITKYPTDQSWSKFWKEYEQSLQKRNKWAGMIKYLNPINLVLIHNITYKKIFWLTGVYVQMYPSQDGIDGNKESEQEGLVKATNVELS